MTCASHAYALHTIIEGTSPRTVRMNVDVTGSHHATCGVGYGTGRTGISIGTNCSISVQTDACASRSKIIVPISSRNNRTTIGNQPIMLRNTSRIDFARIVNRKRAGRLRQRNVHLIRKTLPRLFHIQTFRLTSSHIPQLASNSSSQWKNCPADRPISNPILPVSGEILPLTATSESQFLQSVEESGPQDTPYCPKPSSEWRNPPAGRPKNVRNVPACGRIRTLADTDCGAAIRCAAKRACERRRNGSSPCGVGGSQPLRPQ